VANNLKNPIDDREVTIKTPLNLVASIEKTNVLELLPPGSFATIDNQPNDLPPFQVIHCKGGRCWVRQQSWGKFVHWEVPHHRLKSA
tara:strand:- start:1806 stop:2066 length:261 start_codon:yes stop_codon:yes gene_type:complete